MEKALLLAGKKFPPMLPRILRVTRAKNIDKTTSGAREPKGTLLSRGANNTIHIAKPDPQKQSLSGRAGKLFGRAGAAKLRGTGSNTTTLGQRGSMKSTNDGTKTSTAAPPVFEGYRASSAGKKGVKVVPRKGKPQSRSSKRGSAFKSGGFKTKRAKVREERARGEK